jgi:hypothetical protein
MNIRALLLITIAFCWITVDLYVFIGNISLRETRLSVIARLLDRLPTAASNPIFLALWGILLLGWALPLALGFKRLLRRQSSH